MLNVMLHVLKDIILKKKGVHLTELRHAGFMRRRLSVTFKCNASINDNTVSH